MKTIKLTIIAATLTASLGAGAFFGFGEDEKIATKTNTLATTEVQKTVEECEAPSWAKAIGHEQKWKLHNGCPSTENTETSE